MEDSNIGASNIDCSAWVEGCMIHTDFFESSAAAFGNMVACYAADVLHVMVPEVLQEGYPRDLFISDLGNVQFVQAVFSRFGENALRLSFEDGSNAPYQVSFQKKHVRLLADHADFTNGAIGWFQFHFGSEVFSRIIEYRMLAYEMDCAPNPLPEPPLVHFDKEVISHASEIRLERFVDRFFELCGNDCYDFEEFLAEVHRLFRHEWEHLKLHLVKAWNIGAQKHGRGFLKVSEKEGLRLVLEPRFDFADFINPTSNKI